MDRKTKTKLDQIDTLLGEGGTLSKSLENYEFRPEQVEICKTILKAFEERTPCLVEAGTGVGKSLAYLIPAVITASQGKRTVISTHTINLQTQLIQKDIPLVCKLFPSIIIKASLMKGRGNYLCHQDMDYARDDLFLSTSAEFEKISKWARTTTTGDVGDLPFSWPHWQEIACNQDTCRARECHYFEKCFYFNMRKDAATANIIVVNHALLLCDLEVADEDADNKLIPSYDALVIDEAHHLETVATKTFGCELDNANIHFFVERLRRLKGLDLNMERLEAVDILNQKLFEPFLDMKGDYFYNEAIPKDRGEVTTQTATTLCTMLEGVENELLNRAKEQQTPLLERLQGYARVAGRLRENLNLLIFSDSPNHIRWGETSSHSKGRRRSAEFNQRCNLHLTPIEVSSILKDKLWNRIATVVLTSATLSNSGGFEYIKSRIGAPERIMEKLVDSPFDFKRQSLLYVPWNLPEPPKFPVNAYVLQVCDEIERIVGLTEGRAFLLFTSWRMMNECYEILKDKLRYPLYKQGDQPPGKLLEDFRNSGCGCLFGVQTFWEGVDVRGDALSCVIIDRLPFGVPDSPINRARVDAIISQGGDWFKDFSIPQAQIRLKQGFGRLIRTHQDKGMVCILDSRIHHKNYGKEFVEYLPQSRRASKWDNAKRIWQEILTNKGV